MKIVITDADTVTNGDLDLDIFRKYGELEVFRLTAFNERISRLKDADAVLLNKTVLDEETLSACPRLKYIGLFATGYNNIDIEYCRAHGITVSNAGSYSTNAVAQTAWAFILNHFNQISRYEDFVKKGGWNTSPTFSAFVYPTREAAGKTLGIVGCGSIGRKVASIATAFDMRVLVCPHDLKKALQHAEPGITYVDFDTLLRESDVISCHCPLNKDSEKMFDAEAFARMKEGAFFVNTARGGLVDEKALREALDSGHLSGAGVDVLTQEPMQEGNLLKDAANICITPHVAWAPFETRVRLLRIVEENLAGFIAGEPKNRIC